MIHRIEASPNFVIYTGDAGAEQLDNAFREVLLEEINRLKEIERRKELYKVIDENKQKRNNVMKAFIKSLKK